MTSGISFQHCKFSLKIPMSTATCFPPAPVPLHRPWLHRLFADLSARWQPRPAVSDAALYGDLAHLSEETLRDIGAPDWVHERDRGVPLWTLERARW